MASRSAATAEDPCEFRVKVVLDTNVVLSALLFPRGRLAWFRDSWRAGVLQPLASRDTVEELVRALACPKFQLEHPEVEALLGEYLPHVSLVTDRGPRVAPVLRGSDPDDRKFLDFAAAGRAEALVTGARALLTLSGRAPFPIETPEAFRARLS